MDGKETGGSEYLHPLEVLRAADPQQYSRLYWQHAQSVAQFSWRARELASPVMAFRHTFASGAPQTKPNQPARLRNILQKPLAIRVQWCIFRASDS
jgi:hypothetical protein